MTAYSAARGRRPSLLFLMTLGLALASNGQTARAEQLGQGKMQEETPAVISARPASATAAKRSREEGEDAEEEMIEIDPLLRLQLLSTILITSPDVFKNTSTSGVTLAPFTSSTSSNDNGDVGIQGELTPNAPEPASLVLGAVGAGIVLLTRAVRRRRRRRSAAAA